MQYLQWGIEIRKVAAPQHQSFTHLSQAHASKLCLTCASCREFSEDKDVAARTTALFNCDISFPCCVSWERRTKPKKPIYKPPGSENYLPGIRWKYSKCLQRTLGLWVGRTTDLLIYSSLTGIEWLVWNLQRLPRISQSKTAVPLPFPSLDTKAQLCPWVPANPARGPNGTCKMREVLRGFGGLVGMVSGASGASASAISRLGLGRELQASVRRSDLRVQFGNGKRLGRFKWFKCSVDEN